MSEMNHKYGFFFLCVHFHFMNFLWNQDLPRWDFLEVALITAKLQIERGVSRLTDNLHGGGWPLGEAGFRP